jgi:hypothetical protein
LLIGTGIGLEGRFSQSGPEAIGSYQLDDTLNRCWEEHPEGLDMGVPAPGSKPLQEPIGVDTVASRSQVVRARREKPHGFSHRIGLGDRSEFCLELSLGLGRLGAEASDRRLVSGSEPRENAY